MGSDSPHCSCDLMPGEGAIEKAGLARRVVLLVGLALAHERQLAAHGFGVVQQPLEPGRGGGRGGAREGRGGGHRQSGAQQSGRAVCRRQGWQAERWVG